MAVTVTVRLVASLRARLKVKSVSAVMMENASARDLLAALYQQQPALSGLAFDTNGALLPGVLLLVNGRHVDFLQGLDTPISAADDLLLMPPVAGG